MSVCGGGVTCIGDRFCSVAVEGCGYIEEICLLRIEGHPAALQDCLGYHLQPAEW